MKHFKLGFMSAIAAAVMTYLCDVISTLFLNSIFDYTAWIMNHGFVALCGIGLIYGLWFYTIYSELTQ